MGLEFKTHRQCVDYLVENFYKSDFKARHTRKELAYILTIIESWVLGQSPYAFRSMCKERMCRHIAFYLELHEGSRIRRQEFAQKLRK